MSPLPFHLITNLQALVFTSRGPVWPVMGGSEDGGDSTAGQQAGQQGLQDQGQQSGQRTSARLPQRLDTLSRRWRALGGSCARG